MIIAAKENCHVGTLISLSNFNLLNVILETFKVAQIKDFWIGDILVPFSV